MPQKLSKIAKEFNVGISNVVEFLMEKGYEIECKLPLFLD